MKSINIQDLCNHSIKIDETVKLFHKKTEVSIQIVRKSWIRTILAFFHVGGHNPVLLKKTLEEALINLDTHSLNVSKLNLLIANVQRINTLLVQHHTSFFSRSPLTSISTQSLEEKVQLLQKQACQEIASPSAIPIVTTESIFITPSPSETVQNPQTFEQRLTKIKQHILKENTSSFSQSSLIHNLSHQRSNIGAFYEFDLYPKYSYPLLIANDQIKSNLSSTLRKEALKKSIRIVNLRFYANRIRFSIRTSHNRKFACSQLDQVLRRALQRIAV